MYVLTVIFTENCIQSVVPSQVGNHNTANQTTEQLKIRNIIRQITLLVRRNIGGRIPQQLQYTMSSNQIELVVNSIIRCLSITLLPRPENGDRHIVLYAKL